MFYQESYLVTDEGEEILQAGQAAGFVAGVTVGHCLYNHTEAIATYLEIGDRLFPLTKKAIAPNQVLPIALSQNKAIAPTKNQQQRSPQSFQKIIHPS